MSNVANTEKPFNLAIPDADIEHLQRALELARFPDELDGAGWDYGAPLADVKRLVAHWKSGFDWRKAEVEINKLPMSTRDIEVDGFGTLNVHYVHQVSDVKGAIPLLFVHGWPGHFLEVRKMLPLLTAGGEDHPSFHVVAPSLPGFGFSEAPHKPGFKGPQYAELLNKLMLSLGYDEYVYQGGDWGLLLGRYTAFQYGHKHVKAWHTNMPLIPLLYTRSLLTMPFDKTAQRKLAETSQFMVSGRGYSTQQSTRPQTIGYGLSDSPVGLLAWIYEKLVWWSDKYPWTDDEVLEWISIYWFSRAGPAASTRIYYETSNGGAACDRPPSWLDLVRLPKLWSQSLGKLVFESEHDAGGHFAAFEVPEKLAGDLRKMYGKGGSAFGVISGKTGYDRAGLDRRTRGTSEAIKCVVQ
ncbi:epoxide hydrolase [Ganoderma leucocontextum]|nr:epoxide hydrolase [Ganoderma leucocontextum]